MSDKPSSISSPLFRYLPSIDYLLSCSKETLHDLELAALNRVANHLKTARLEWEEAAAQKEVAAVARWLIETRDLLLEQASRTLEIKQIDPVFPSVVEIEGPRKGLDALLGRPTKDDDKG